jgi:glucosamine--fructose-6-phosphate aminotransferase (isomerizing)
MAVIANGELAWSRCVGKVKNLEESAGDSIPVSTIGIAHTRWATHGEPSEANAHPQVDCSGTIAVVHNGIIENHAALRQLLEQLGHTFSSATDTEAIAHLIEERYKVTHCLAAAVRLALQDVKGPYGIAVLSSHEPGVIVAARNGSPLVVGIGDGEVFVTSDPSALAGYTNRVVYLSDGEMAVLSKDNPVFKTLDNIDIIREPEEIDLSLEEIEKGGFPHFMLKEIFEQPHTILDSLRGRLLDDDGSVVLGGLHDVMPRLLQARRIILTGCGTSWHSALVGEYMLERFARVPVEVEYASEFRYRGPVITPEDVVFAISQSGETADTLAALREAKQHGALTLGICNVVGSTIARETDGGVYLHAGPEIGVASTKAFTSQLTVLTLVALAIGRSRTLTPCEGKAITTELRAIPQKICRMLDSADLVERIAWAFRKAPYFLYLGRGCNFPVALEGALKMKEISYIPAEGYPAAEMKHGPIALVDEGVPVVFIAPQDACYDKMMANMEEVRARHGRVIVVANENDHYVDTLADHVIRIPRTLDILTPILSSVPLQLLAYYTAVLKGCDVDQPRNLAKSVTVE